MAISRGFMVAIALTIVVAGAEARGVPSGAPVRADTGSSLFAELGLEGLSLDMFPGEEGDTVTRTFTPSPGQTQTVSVTRSPGGAVSVKTSTQWSSLDGLSTSSPDPLPSQMDFSSFQSAFDKAFQTGGDSLSDEKLILGSKIGAFANIATPSLGGSKLATSVGGVVTSAAAPKAKGNKKATKNVVTSPAAPKAKGGKKSTKKQGKKSTKKDSKKSTKKVSKTKASASERSAIDVTPLAPVEKELIEGSDVFPTFTTKEAGVPVSAPLVSFGDRSSTPSTPKSSKAAPKVTPARSASVDSAPGRVRVEQSTRASKSTGPTSAFEETRASKDGVTAHVVTGASVGPSPLSEGRATGEACSDTETSTEAVERCVNAVRQNPSKYAKLLACDIPVYTPRAPLASSRHLGVAASAHARDMASTKSVTHAGSDGSTMGSRIWDRAGFVGSPIAENVAGGQKSAKEVVFAWMCSSGHRKNIMSCAHDSMGTGLTRNGQVYWAQTFGCTKYNKCVC